MHIAAHQSHLNPLTHAVLIHGVCLEKAIQAQQPLEKCQDLKSAAARPLTSVALWPVAVCVGVQRLR